MPRWRRARPPSAQFIDDDVIAAPQLLAEHLAANREEPVALCIGKLIQRPPNARDWFGDANATGWNMRYDELAQRQPDWADCYGANFSVSRQALIEVGGFNRELDAIEDIELGYRLVAAGYVPVYRAAAEALHDDEKPRRRIVADIVQFGRFCAEFGDRHRIRARAVRLVRRDDAARTLAATPDDRPPRTPRRDRRRRSCPPRCRPTPAVVRLHQPLRVLVRRAPRDDPATLARNYRRRPGLAARPRLQRG